MPVTCSRLLGGQVGQKISNCTGSGAIATDAGKSPARGTSVVSTRTINWSNGKKTVLSYTYVDHSGKADTCAIRAAYTKDYQTIEKGQVSKPGTTTRGMVGGTVRATLCLYELTKAPHTVFVVNQGKITI